MYNVFGRVLAARLNYSSSLEPRSDHLTSLCSDYCLGALQGELRFYTGNRNRPYLSSAVLKLDTAIARSRARQLRPHSAAASSEKHQKRKTAQTARPGCHAVVQTDASSDPSVDPAAAHKLSPHTACGRSQAHHAHDWHGRGRRGVRGHNPSNHTAAQRSPQHDQQFSDAQHAQPVSGHESRRQGICAAGTVPCRGHVGSKWGR